MIQSQMIRASAGSGKTYQLANRYLALLVLGVDAEKIIALTFTKKAAGEFAGRIMTRLAKASSSDKKAAELSKDLIRTIHGNESQPALIDDFLVDLPEMNAVFFQNLLLSVIRKLDRLALNTLDSYFVKIVRNFWLELGLSGFCLLEDDAQKVEKRNSMSSLFGSGRVAKQGKQNFLQQFKLATLGREENRLVFQLGAFIDDYYNLWLSTSESDRWGNTDFLWKSACPFPKVENFHSKANKVIRLLDTITEKKNGYIKNLENAFLKIGEYKEGSKITIPSAIFRMLAGLESLKNGSFKDVFYKTERHIKGELATAIYELLGGLIRSEIEHAARRTRGLYGVIRGYNRVYHEQVRKRGRLGFSDITRLIADDDLLGLTLVEQRALLDYRLDARYDHWLLDEFQDTSLVQWRGIESLIDEVMQDDSGQRSLFVVGDSKQSIYGWRGGEPKLFDELSNYYEKQIISWGMEKSYRSTAEVLSLVNEVFSIQEDKWLRLFGKAAVDRWNFSEHVSASSNRGHSLVIECNNDEDSSSGEKQLLRYKAMIDILKEVSPVERGLSCAILVAKNQQVNHVVNFLRNKIPEMLVAAEGDSMVATSVEGALILDLFRWVQSPEHTFGWKHVRYSSVWAILCEYTGVDDKNKQWQRMHEKIAQVGICCVVHQFVNHIKKLELNEYGLRMLDEVLLAVFDFSENGTGSLKEWISLLEARKVRETTREGMIQVMTVHRSKGLGFDVVILPELDESDSFDNKRRLGLLQKRGRLGIPEFLIQRSVNNIEKFFPVLASILEEWEDEQRYESFCKFYVALTRAKLASYCIVDCHSEEFTPKQIQSHWLREAIASFDGCSVKSINGNDYSKLYESGDWVEVNREKSNHIPEVIEMKKLQVATPRVTRKVASGQKKYKVVVFLNNRKGMRFGDQVHQVLERISWIDESAILGGSDAERLVDDCFKNEKIRQCFTKPESSFRLLREQPLETFIDGSWVSGVVDRAIITYKNDKVDTVQVIDFKTDENATEELLKERYNEQLIVYRRALSQIYSIPQDRVICFLLSTSLKKLVAI